MKDRFRRIRLLSMSRELEASVRSAGDTLVALRERIEDGERALAELPGSSWEEAGRRPTRRETARLRAARHAIVDAMARDLERFSPAFRSIHTAAGLAVLREANFDAAASLLRAERELSHFGRQYVACIEGEWAVSRVDPLLDALRPEDRAEVLAMTRAVRSALARARPRIAALPLAREGERARLAEDLRDEIERTWARTSGLEALQMSYVPEIQRRVDAGDLDAMQAVTVFLELIGLFEPGFDKGERGMVRRARRAWYALSRVLARRSLKACRALHFLQSAWGSELGAMKESIAFYAGTPKTQRGRAQEQELARRRSGLN